MTKFTYTLKTDKEDNQMSSKEFHTNHQIHVHPGKDAMGKSDEIIKQFTKSTYCLKTDKKDVQMRSRDFKHFTYTLEMNEEDGME